MFPCVHLISPKSGQEWYCIHSVQVSLAEVTPIPSSSISILAQLKGILNNQHPVCLFVWVYAITDFPSAHDGKS